MAGENGESYSLQCTVFLFIMKAGTDDNLQGCLLVRNNMRFEFKEYKKVGEETKQKYGFVYSVHFPSYKNVNTLVDRQHINIMLLSFRRTTQRNKQKSSNKMTDFLK